MTNQKDTIIQQTIIEELGLQKLSEEEKVKIMVDFLELVLKRLYMETMDKLSQEDQQELMKMLEEKENQEKVEVFLRSRINDYDEFVKKIVEDLKDELKEDIASLGENKTEELKEDMGINTTPTTS
jgi:hypothetical protein